MYDTEHEEWYWSTPSSMCMYIEIYIKVMQHSKREIPYVIYIIRFTEHTRFTIVVKGSTVSVYTGLHISDTSRENISDTMP